MTNTNQKIDPVLALRDQLRLKRDRLAEKLAEVEKELHSAETIIRLLGQREQEEQEPVPNMDSKELRGMTQLEAVKRIAQRNSGRVKITVAKKLLVGAGLLNGAPKNHYNILTTIIKRSEEFEHVGPGEYELKKESTPPVMALRRVAN